MLFLQNKKLWVTSEPDTLLDKKERAFMKGKERTSSVRSAGSRRDPRKIWWAAAAKQHVMFWTSLDLNRVWTAGGEQHSANQLDLFVNRFDSNHIPICHLSSFSLSYSSSAADNTTIPRLSSPLSSQPPPSLSPPLFTPPPSQTFVCYVPADYL